MLSKAPYCTLLAEIVIQGECDGEYEQDKQQPLRPGIHLESRVDKGDQGQEVTRSSDGFTWCAICQRMFF